jgi:hypothetical protein
MVLNSKKQYDLITLQGGTGIQHSRCLERHIQRRDNRIVRASVKKSYFHSDSLTI